MEQPVGFVDGKGQVASKSKNPTSHRDLQKVLRTTADFHSPLRRDNVGQQVHDPFRGKVTNLDRPNEVIMVLLRRLR